MRLMATSDDSGEYQNWQFVKKRSRLSNHNRQIQTSNRFLPLEETKEDWNEAENGDQEEICPNNNISPRQRGKTQLHRPKSPNGTLKRVGGFIKHKSKIVPGNQTYAETVMNICKIGIIGIFIFEH